MPPSPGFFLPHGLFCFPCSCPPSSLSRILDVLRLPQTSHLHSLLGELILKSRLRPDDYQTDTSNWNLFQILSWHTPLLVHTSSGISPRPLTTHMSENKRLPAPPQTCSFHGSLRLVSGNLVPPVALANYQAPSLTPSSHPASITSANPMSSTFKIYPNPTTSRHLHCHQSSLSHRHLRPELLH